MYLNSDEWAFGEVDGPRKLKKGDVIHENGADIMACAGKQKQGVVALRIFIIVVDTMNKKRYRFTRSNAETCEPLIKKCTIHTSK